MSRQNGVRLTVQGAEKRDAGRGVARIPESARKELGVLSGDTVVIEGTRTTVAKVWPADPDAPSGIVRIDADTRANAGVHIGESVTVARRSVENGERVTLAPPPSYADVDPSVVTSAVHGYLEGRPVSTGEQLRLERVAEEPFRVVATRPDGPVRITPNTTVELASEPHEGPLTADESDDDSSEDRGGVAYEDIGGLDDELEQVREMIELPLNEPEVFQRLGITPPKGVLLYGPPGTGKTLIARAVANEVDASFTHVSGPEIMSKYKGESEGKLREYFQEAKENAPAIIFFDEIDSIASARDDSSDAENRVVGQLLSLMDGLDARGDVIVIAATNRVDAIDPALRRGGRFDREIEIGVPDKHGRLEILQVMTRGMPLADDVDLPNIAARTHGFVGADLQSLVTEAAMTALPRFRGTGGAGDDEDGERDEGDGETAGGREDPTVTRADFDAALAAVEPSAMREYVAEAPSTTFADVGGLREAKRVLTEAVEWPLQYERLFSVTNTDPPSGVLLYGPPGTGKTMLARALAGETEVNFVHVDGPELIDKYVGESEKAVRRVFERARQSAPSILFLDEIDAVAGRRGETHEVTERVVSQLLTELDGLADNPNLVVLAATNRREALDPALTRPGRLDTHVEVPEPDVEARRAILRVHAEGKPFAEDVDLDELAADLSGYTGADIAAIVRDASMRAIREKADELGPEAANDRAEEVRITREHVYSAVQAVRPTGSDR